MNRTQMGRVGELALALYAMVSSDGALELFTPVSDDDHVDITIGRRGAIPSIAIQVKAAPQPDPHGVVEANASFPVGDVREHPAFLYALVLMDRAVINTAWVVPSHDFNRLAYRIVKSDAEVLEFRAYPDRDDKWWRYRVPPMELGPHLLSVIDSLGEHIPRDFLERQTGVVLGLRKAPAASPP